MHTSTLKLYENTASIYIYSLIKKASLSRIKRLEAGVKEAYLTYACQSRSVSHYIKMLLCKINSESAHKPTYLPHPNHIQLNIKSSHYILCKTRH